MKGFRLSAALLLALSAAVPLACGATASTSGSNTNWLKPCSDDGDCADQYSCLCGVCTSACEVEEDACTQTSAQCTDLAELGCAPNDDDDDDGACLPPCSEDAECDSFGSGLACESGVCIAKTALEPDKNPPTNLDLPDLEPLSGPAKVALGGNFTCVTRAGQVWCWGQNQYGQVTATPDWETEPIVSRQGLEDVTEIVAGGQHACALTGDGSVFCWGINDFGQVGPNSAPEMTCSIVVLDVGPMDVPCQPTPTRVPGIEGAVSLVANVTTTCAVFDDGTFTCWGVEAGFIPPEAHELDGGIRDLSLGDDQVCAIERATDELWCAGEDDTPILENGALRQVDLAPDYDGSPDFVCMLDVNGRVDCWGRDGAGQRGLGDFESPPPHVNDPPAIAEGARAVQAGHDHACAILDDGVVECWGKNERGQTGIPPNTAPRCGGTPCQPSPTPVAGVPLAAELEIWGDTTCVLSEDAELYCWGGNDVGTPWKVPGPWEGGKDDCDGIDQAIATEIQALRQTPLSDVRCRTDSDCVEVDFGVSCQSGCASAPLDRELAVPITTELARIEDTYCESAEDLGCNFESPECPKQEGTLACVAGTCVRFDADVTGCEDACSCAVLEQLGAAPPEVEPECEGHHLELYGFVPCTNCYTSRLYLAVVNRGQSAFEGEATIEFEAPDADLALPEPMTLTLSIEPGEHSEPLYFEFGGGPASAVARILAPDNCAFNSEWSDVPIEIPATPACPK